MGYIFYFFLARHNMDSRQAMLVKKSVLFIIGIEVRSITNNKIIYGQNLKILRWDHISIKKNNGNKLLYLTFVPWTKIHVSVTSD